MRRRRRRASQRDVHELVRRSAPMPHRRSGMTVLGRPLHECRTEKPMSSAFRIDDDMSDERASQRNKGASESPAEQPAEPALENANEHEARSPRAPDAPPRATVHVDDDSYADLPCTD